MRDDSANLNQHTRAPSHGLAVLSSRVVPGSEWRFVAIEASPAVVDRLLVEVVQPLVDELGRAYAVERWFCARHPEPRWHLRLHLHGDPARLAGEALPAVRAQLAPLVQAGLVGPVWLEPDARAAEHLGGAAAIDACEALFCADSAAVVAVLAVLGPDDDERRWLATAVGVDRLLADLGLGVTRRLAAVERLSATTASTCVDDPPPRDRAVDEVLDGLISRERTPPWAAPVLRAFGERGVVLGVVGRALRELEAARLLECRVDDLVAAFLRLHVNRVARFGVAAEEAALYARLAAAYRRCLRAGRRLDLPRGAGAGG